MRLYQKPGSQIWAVDYDDPETGKRRRVSTGLKDKNEARKKARDIVLGVADVRPPPTPTANPSPAPEAKPRTAAGATMDRVWTRCELTVWSPRECKSQRTVKSNLKILRDIRIEVNVETDGEVSGGGDGEVETELVRFADLEVSKVNYTKLEALAAALRAAGYAPGTIKRKLDMVSKSLTMAAKWDLIRARPPIPQFKVDNARQRILSEREEVLAFEAIAARQAAEPTRDWKRMAMLFRFLLDQACRLGETLKARDTWFEQLPIGDNGELHWVISIPAWATKTNKARQLPLTAEVVANLPYLLEHAVPATDEYGGRRLFPYTPSTPWYHWKNIRDDLAMTGVDISDVVLHTFRHTCLTRMHKRRVPLEIISKFAGHASVAITAAVYVKQDANTLLRAIAA